MSGLKQDECETQWLTSLAASFALLSTPMAKNATSGLNSHTSTTMLRSVFGYTPIEQA